LDSLTYLPLNNLKVIDLDTAEPCSPGQEGSATFVALDVPIVDDKQSAHIKITGTLNDSGDKLVKGELVFDRTLKGLRKHGAAAGGVGSIRSFAIRNHRNIRRSCFCGAN
jgi:hypothetical protein